MATIDISPSAGTPASTGYLIYTDAATGTFKKAPLSALPLSDAMVTALAAKQATLVSGTNIKTINGTSVLGSGDLTIDGSATTTTFNGTIKFDKILGRYATVNSSNISGAITVDATGAVQLGCYYLVVVEDGGGEPTFTGFKFADNAEAYDTTNGNSTLYMFQNVGGTYHAGTLQQGVAVVVPQLDTPTFTASAISDTEIDLTAISYDSDSEAMTIERATNAGFTTGLTEIYSGVPKSSHNDTGLTPSTHYYYRIQTTATGFTASLYGTDDDTTDATGLTPLSTPGSFSLVADSATTVTCTWADIANEVNFSVQIATNAGFSAGVQAATKSAGVLTHQFTGLTPGTTYYGHVKGIGDGVTFSDSAYSTADNDTTPAVTLNAPTSFAAGTPTPDGAPFTWNDTNTSPAESSYLIQITTAADTGYAAVVATRTPAANATSAAAGTGLTASTNYRARIKAVGNGTSTNDSAYSSEVTFSTAAAGGVVPLDFTGSTDFVNTVGTKWMAGSGGAAYGKLGKATTMLPSGQDGRIITLFNNVDSNGVNFGFNTANAEVGYAGMEAAFAITLGGGGGGSIIRIDSANGAPAVCYSTLSAGDLVSLNRVGSVLTIEVSTDSGATWGITAYTFTYSSSADFWIVVDSFGNDQGASSGTLVAPEGENLV